MQYIPVLKHAGFKVEVESLFDASYIDNFYAGRRVTSEIFAAYRRRIVSLRKKRDIDLIWLEKEALPYVPAWLELGLFPKSVPIVVDYDDAVFHRYDHHSRRLVRGLLRGKIDCVMQSAQMVVAGNAHLGDVAVQAGASRVEIVPTVVDVEAYDASPRNIPTGRMTVGWIGTPETWRRCVQPFKDAIRTPVGAHGGHFLGVGIGERDAEASWMEVRDWSEAREVSDIREMDIGIMPLPDTPWMRGKCGYKLIQYMACGLPVVASPVGVNRNIVEHGVNGFLAESDDEWRDAIITLLSDADLRHRMGAAGRKKVEEQYSLQVWGPRVAQMLRKVAEGQAHL